MAWFFLSSCIQILHPRVPLKECYTEASWQSRLGNVMYLKEEFQINLKVEMKKWKGGWRGVRQATFWHCPLC